MRASAPSGSFRCTATRISTAQSCIVSMSSYHLRPHFHLLEMAFRLFFSSKCARSRAARIYFIFTKFEEIPTLFRELKTEQKIKCKRVARLLAEIIKHTHTPAQLARSQRRNRLFFFVFLTLRGLFSARIGDWMNDSDYVSIDGECKHIINCE